VTPSALRLRTAVRYAVATAAVVAFVLACGWAGALEVAW